MAFCTHCGHANSDSARFCSNCGHRIIPPERPVESTGTVSFGSGLGDADGELADAAEMSAADAAAIEALPEGSALLVVLRGPGAGSRFLLDTAEVAAGRHPDSDIFLDDVTVSRRHAAFRRTPDGYRVHDVGSLNGTYVNRTRIDELLLSERDEVQIGKFRLKYFSGQQRSATGAS